jgi:hypothetical protein
LLKQIRSFNKNASRGRQFDFDEMTSYAKNTSMENMCCVKEFQEIKEKKV